MIDFIKWNWAQLLGIAGALALAAVLNAHILSVTQGHYNIITILFS